MVVATFVHAQVAPAAAEYLVVEEQPVDGVTLLDASGATLPVTGSQKTSLPADGVWVSLVPLSGHPAVGALPRFFT